MEERKGGLSEAGFTGFQGFSGLEMSLFYGCPSVLGERGEDTMKYRRLG